MNYIPYILENTGNGERGYDIYSRLLKDRIILLSGKINDDIAQIVISELLYLDSIETKNIWIYINSPGGSISSGLAIYDTIHFINSQVNTVWVGIAMSMAAFLLSSATGKRYALPNSEIMIHQPYGGMQGVVSDIDIQAKRLLNIKEKMNQMLANNTKKTIEEIEHDTERDNYMSADEALAYGIIDEIMKKKLSQKQPFTNFNGKRLFLTS